MYKALILDMDGTLLNSEEMVLVSLREVMAEYGVAITPVQEKMSLGCTAETLMQELGLGERSEEVAERWRVIMGDRLHRVLLYDGCDLVLDAPLRRGVVTSQVRGELSANLARLHIANRFEFTVCADELPFQKPHPEPLLHCLRKMGIRREEALFVGDSVYDMGCALAAGVDFGLALWGAGDAAEFAQAKYVFRHPEDILAYITETV